MPDEYLHSWKAERGYYHLHPFRWMDDDECDILDAEERAWRESRLSLPTTDYGWRRFFGLPLPRRSAKSIDKDEVRERVDFARVLELYGVRFRRRGDTGTGRCPFHDDKNASLSIHFKKKVFHCFACGAAGDIFRFVELKNDYTFTEALRELDRL